MAITKEQYSIGIGTAIILKIKHKTGGFLHNSIHTKL